MEPRNGCGEHYIHVETTVENLHTENVVNLIQERYQLWPKGFSVTHNFRDLLVSLVTLPHFLRVDPG